MYQLAKHSSGAFYMVDVAARLAWRITSINPEREARCRAAGAEIGGRQLGHVADGSYGDEARAWLQACQIVGVTPRFAWRGIENVLGDYGSVSPSMAPSSWDDDFWAAIEIAADLVKPQAVTPVRAVARVESAGASAPASVPESWDEYFERRNRERAEAYQRSHPVSSRIVGGTRRRRNARRRVNG